MKTRLTGVIISLMAASLLLPVKGFAQEPAMPAYSNFKTVRGAKVFTPDNLWDYINGGADSYNALGFEELKIFEYTKGKKISVKVELYRHRDRVMAFGIYALERSPSYNFIDLGVQGYEGEGHANFCKGNYYVKVYTYSKSSKALAAVGEIARLVEGSIPGESSVPEILTLFPAAGKRANEELFISENVLGHSFLSDAFRASYTVGGKEFYLYLFEGDEERIGRMAHDYLKRQQLDTDNLSEGKSMFEDGYNGYIFMQWKPGIMVLVTGLNGSDSALAETYLGQTAK